jgi:hypothetical protein
MPHLRNVTCKPDHRCLANAFQIFPLHYIISITIMSSVEPPVFSYQPLTESDAIRLILLHPAPTVSTELECSIEHVTLSQYGQDLINHYTALSYVWGEPMDTKHILVNGCSFHITLNLDSALRHLRDTKSPIRVWADALCL